VTTFNLDEYSVWRRNTASRITASCGEFYFSTSTIAKKNVNIPDGLAKDVPKFCAKYEKQIRAAGGIDLQVLGIGTDGHIGFNEPTSSLASRTRIKTLTPQTRKDNARFFSAAKKAVPHHCSRWASAQFLMRDTIAAGVLAKIRRVPSPEAVEGPITAMNPASVLQLHPKTTVCLDEAAASELKLTEYYRWVF